MATSIYQAASATATAETGQGSIKKLLWAAPLSGLIAAGLNALVFSIYSAIGFQIFLPFPDPADPTQTTTPLLLVFVVVLSFLPALAAGGLLWLLTKFTRNPFTNFFVISGVALLLSFGLSLPLDMPVTFKLGLDLMHVVAACAIVGGLTLFTRSASSR